MSSSTGTYWEAARVPPSVFYDRLIAFDASYYEEIRVGFAMPQNETKKIECTGLICSRARFFVL